MDAAVGFQLGVVTVDDVEARRTGAEARGMARLSRSGLAWLLRCDRVVRKIRSEVETEP